MAFRDNCIATVWENKNGTVIEDTGKVAKVYITTSKRNKQSNKYETDFSSIVSFVGDAYKKIKEMTLKSKDRIKLLSVETTIIKYNNKYYTNFTCFDCEDVDNNQIPKQPNVVNQPPLEEIDETKLPF